MNYEQPIYFYILLVIPVVLLLFFAVQLWRRSTQKKFANTSLLERLSPTRSRLKVILKVLVLCLAIACMTFALVNPKIGTKLETVKREGVDVVFALDVSKSMLAEDIAPNRLEKSKQLITQILNELGGDRVGIIGYAGSAFPQVPITTDFASTKLFLNAMDTDMVSSQGTAISEAVQMSTTYFDDEEQKNRVLFVISDGEDHEGNFKKAIEAATENGIKVYAIGVGTEQGGQIPIKRNGVLQFYKRDKENQIVITRLGEPTLQAIADEGNGKYINGENTQSVVEEVKAILNGMDKKEFEAKQFTDFKDQFQWFLAGALFLLLFDVFLLDRKTKWINRLNLFNEKRA
jgi:Ca-activated chloride channel family protein